jgi:membrane-bound serine protease (ClpP class)
MFNKVFLAVLAAGSLSAAAPKVIAVDIDGVIHPITVAILTHALDQAASQDAAAVLLRLNTPGGLLDATRQMNEKIVASHVPVIAYVTPSGGRAASAGFFILQAADVAAMAPGTNTELRRPWRSQARWTRPCATKSRTTRRHGCAHGGKARTQRCVGRDHDSRG